MKTKTIKLEFDMDKLESKSSFDFIGVDRERAIEITEYVIEYTTYNCKSKEIAHLIEKYDGAELIVALVAYGWYD